MGFPILVRCHLYIESGPRPFPSWSWPWSKAAQFYFCTEDYLPINFSLNFINTSSIYITACIIYVCSLYHSVHILWDPYFVQPCRSLISLIWVPSEYKDGLSKYGYFHYKDSTVMIPILVRQHYYIATTPWFLLSSEPLYVVTLVGFMVHVIS